MVLVVGAGHKGWKRIHESIEEQRKLLEYRTLHAGKDPPVPLGRAICRAIFPCLFPAKVKISPAILAEAASHDYM